MEGRSLVNEKSNLAQLLPLRAAFIHGLYFNYAIVDIHPKS